MALQMVASPWLIPTLSTLAPPWGHIGTELYATSFKEWMDDGLRVPWPYLLLLGGIVNISAITIFSKQIPLTDSGILGQRIVLYDIWVKEENTVIYIDTFWTNILWCRICFWHRCFLCEETSAIIFLTVRHAQLPSTIPRGKCKVARNSGKI